MTKIKVFRILSVLILILVVLLGVAYKSGYGTICSLGVGGLLQGALFTCPLGFLQLCFASRELLPQLWLSVALALFSIILLGRFFCAWVCPTLLLQDIFKGKGGSKPEKKNEGEDHAIAQQRASFLPTLNGFLAIQPKNVFWMSYSRYAVLGGVLLASFLLGFPVFCLVCPIGLFFGSLFAVIRLFTNATPSLELLIFPALLVLEIVVLKHWCRSICPLGALLGIIGSLNRFFRPTIRKDKCLNLQGIPCLTCKKSCPVGVDLHNDINIFSLKDCTKCLRCYENCPAKAIEIRLFSPFRRRGKNSNGYVRKS